MKGLLRSSYYSYIDTIKYILIILLLSIIFIISSNNTSFLAMYIYSSPILLIISILAGYRKEHSSNYTNYQLSFPINKTTLVKAHYLNFIIWTFIGLITSFIFINLFYIINKHSNEELLSQLSILISSTSITLIIGALFYPIQYLLNNDKSELLILSSLLLSYLINGIILWFMNKIYNVSFDNQSSNMNLWFITFISIIIVIFIISYYLSILLFKKKNRVGDN